MKTKWFVAAVVLCLLTWFLWSGSSPVEAGGNGSVAEKEEPSAEPLILQAPADSVEEKTNRGEGKVPEPQPEKPESEPPSLTSVIDENEAKWAAEAEAARNDSNVDWIEEEYGLAIVQGTFTAIDTDGSRHPMEDGRFEVVWRGKGKHFLERGRIVEGRFTIATIPFGTLEFRNVVLGSREAMVEPVAHPISEEERLDLEGRWRETWKLHVLDARTDAPVK